MAAPERDIRLHLYDGSLQGIVRAGESSWDPGIIYTAPKSLLGQLNSIVKRKSKCILILFSSDRVQISQSYSLHAWPIELRRNEWWEQVAVLSTTDDSLSYTDLDYLEASLITLAHNTSTILCSNKTKTPPRSMGSQKRTYLDEYLNTGLLLMNLLRIGNLHADERKTAELRPNHTPASSQRNGMRQRPGERLLKSEAVQFVRDHGIQLGEGISFSTLQKNSPVFWINPNVRLLSRDWYLILNDNRDYKLIVLHVPANSIKRKQGYSQGVVCRADKPSLIDLQIDSDTLVDNRSKTNFSRFLVTKIPY